MKLVEDVASEVERMSQMVANYHHDVFSMGCTGELFDQKIESPIEQLFYVAFKTVLELNFMEESDSHYTKQGKEVWSGVGITPQKNIGKFRVDFYVYCHNLERAAIVECDSQQFHDRTQKERRYEKIRDRYLQSEGYRLFHFTGSEIKECPEKAAAEVIAYVTGTDIQYLLDGISNYG